jgi:hypothetical protein
MDQSSRTRLVALAVLLAISVPLVLIAVAGGGSGDDEEGLRVEQTPGVQEVVIYLVDPALNTPDTNRGRARVRVECVDGRGEVVFRGEEAWPFSDTDGGEFDPHVHVSMEPDAVTAAERCRLKDTDPPLEGRKV